MARFPVLPDQCSLTARGPLHREPDWPSACWPVCYTLRDGQHRVLGYQVGWVSAADPHAAPFPAHARHFAAADRGLALRTFADLLLEVAAGDDDRAAAPRPVSGRS